MIKYRLQNYIYDQGGLTEADLYFVIFILFPGDMYQTWPGVVKKGQEDLDIDWVFYST